MNRHAISRLTAVIIIIIIIIIATAAAVFLSQLGPTLTTTTTTTTTKTTTTTPIQTTTTTTTTPPPQIPNPDTIIVESIGEPDYLDPAVDYETAGGEVLQNTYETLVWYNGTSATQFIPWLAEKWEVSNNGMSYTFYLRKGIKFQDGTPFNATAVKYSLERTIIIGDPHGPAWIYGVIRGAEALLEKIWNGNATQADVDAWRAQKPIEILDTYTVRINLDRPYAPFLALMAFNLGAGIVSPTYVEAHGGVQIGKQNDWMNRHAEAGTGPFKVISWESGVITLEANPNYWGGPNNIKPKLKYVIRKTVDDVNTRILDFLQGSADIVNIPSDYWNQFIDMNKWL
ncbi:MAG: ABC transporter substrate-binding protein, partial [Thermoprotei archaeon]